MRKVIVLFLIISIITAMIVTVFADVGMEENSSVIAGEICEIVTEKITDDPLFEEIYGLADEIAGNLNDLIGIEGAVSVEDIVFEGADKVYSGLLKKLSYAPENYKEIIAEASYSWTVYTEYNGITYATVLRLSNEGQYRISSTSVSVENKFTQMIEGLSQYGFKGEIYNSSAFVGCPAVIIVNDEEVFVKYYDPEIAKENGIEVDDGVVPLSKVAMAHVAFAERSADTDENGETLMGGNGTNREFSYKVINIAVSVAAISILCLITLFITRKRTKT